jgi:DNA primase
MIPQEHIEAVKSLAKITDVVERLSSVEINSRKSNERRIIAKCNCCGTPNKLQVTIAKNIATCFKCDQTGRTSTLNPVGMLTSPHYGRMTFPEAIRFLADMYYYNLPNNG